MIEKQKKGFRSFMSESAYVPGFTYDIFISYAFATNALDWVSQLREDVEGRLTESRSPAPKVWLSESSRKSGSFKDDIDSAVKDSAVLLTVNCDPYRASTYCIEEKRLFEEQWKPDPKTKRGDRRIVEIIHSLLPTKTPYLNYWDAQPTWFCGNPKKREPEPTFRRGDAEYLTSVEALCGRLRDTLDGMRDENIAVFLDPPLMEANQDDFCGRTYQKLRIALSQKYRLLGHGTDDDAMASAPMSIHLLGGKAADRPTQRRIDFLKAGDHPCIVLTDPYLSSEEAARHPVSVYKRELERQQGTTYKNLAVYPVVPGKWADLLEYIQSRLSSNVRGRADETQVYVICNPQPDDPEFEEFMKLIQDRGRNKLLLLDDPLPSKHEENLAACDGALLVWAKEDQDWFDLYYSDLRFATAHREGKELVAKGVCLMKPDIDKKEALRRTVPGLIDLLKDIDPSHLLDKLEGFLKPLRELKTVQQAE